MIPSPNKNGKFNCPNCNREVDLLTRTNPKGKPGNFVCSVCKLKHLKEKRKIMKKLPIV